MVVEKANCNQESELTAFFEQFEFEDLIQFQIKRPKGFFCFYQSQGHEFETYCLRGKENKILATATFLFPEYFSPTYSKKLKMAIATDLRVLPNRQATLGWHQNFIPVLEMIREERKVDGFLSLLSKNDRKVLNTFLRSNPFKREMPRYFLHQNCMLTSIHGFLPGSKVDLPYVKVRRFQEMDWVALDTFLSKNDDFYLSPINSAADLQKKIKNMGLSEDHLWVATPLLKNKILGLALLFPSDYLQQYIPISYQLRAHNFRQFLKFSSYLGWSHRLTKPKNRTGLELPLKFQHLGFIRVQHADIFQKMIQEIWSTLAIDEFLVYLRDLRNLKITPKTGVLSANMPYDLYSVALPGDNFQSFSDSWGEAAFALDSFNHF
jgi:hypothetical protein